MSNDEFVQVDGVVVDTVDLKISKAQELALALTNHIANWAALVECRRHDTARAHGGAEIVIFEVEVEIPQRKNNDIHRIERLAAVFFEADDRYPEVLALRNGFPKVPHLNLKTPEIPRSLCLYDEPYSEIKLKWTAARFIERIRIWLADTATGTLHREDQHLEPFLIGAHAPIVLPAEFLTTPPSQIPELVSISRINSGPRFCLIGERAQESGETQSNAQKFNAAMIVGEPRPHGIIHQPPASLAELHQFLLNANIDLKSVLRERLRSWHRDNPQLLNGGLVLLVVLPKTRVADGQEETPEVWAFLCFGSRATESDEESISARCPTGAEIGVQLGLWTIADKNLVLLIPPDEEKDGRVIGVAPLNPCFTLTRTSAAQFNGVKNPAGLKILAVGMGALGSQTAANLIRSGYGEWSFVDKDLLLPHNPARHELPGFAVGHAKAESMTWFANTTIAGPPIARAIVADILAAGEAANEVVQRAAEAEVILDFSASVAVARYLDQEVNSAARRLSVFLNPQGTDLILLGEDSQRQTRLTALEMQYYRFLITEEKMAGHLARKEERLRYARSCRDLSAVIPQDLVALHASIASRAIRRTLEAETPVIAVWQAGDDGTVARFDVPVAPVFSERRGDWQVIFDTHVIEQVQVQRAEKLPNETGGVLIGAFDLQRKIVYVVDAWSAPQDSTETPQGFIRGRHGLSEAIERVERVTAAQLTYVGEWHSHPVGHSAVPSDDFDRQLFQWLTEQMAKDGLPPLMLIVSDRNQRGWYLGTLPQFN